MRQFLRSPSSPTGSRATIAALALFLGLSTILSSAPAAAGGFRGHGGGFGHSFGHGYGQAWRGEGRRHDDGYHAPRWPQRHVHERWRPPPRVYVDGPVYDDDYVVERPRRVRPRRHLIRHESAPPPRHVAPKIVRAAPDEKPAPRVRRAQRKPTPAPRQVAAVDPSIAPQEVLCEIRGDVPIAAVDQIARGYGLARESFQRVGLTQSTLYRYTIRNGQSVANVVTRLRADKRIASAQPNMQFRLQDEGAKALAGAQYAISKLQLSEVHRVAKGDGVTVAVLDSGVDQTHPELAGSLAASVNALKSAAAPEAHGTGIASVIAAHTNLVGVAPAAKILAVRAFSGARGDGATGTTADIVRAIEIAVGANARVVNMSFAGPADPLLARVIEAANARGVIFVAAGGNAGPDAAPAYPAADPNVIAVTATDAADALFPSANRGDYIGVAAPGVDVLVATPGDGYGLSSGTSVAAAHVSGLVALMLQEDSKLTPAEARRMLTDNARDLGPAGRDAQFGAGLIDPERTLEAAGRAGRKLEATIAAPAKITGASN
ncbi:MAG: S8 family serine peptidase [Rhodoblastus sp.]|nr:S8 family serine peptidase [Rhodoblastus sp.]